MFLTKECDYGIRIIRALSGGEKQTVRTTCEREHVPQQYAYKILKKLERAGFVQSRQGPNGGYLLAKPLDSYTLYDIITALGEGLSLFECVRCGYSCERDGPETPCAVHAEFCRLQKLVVEEMQKKTMQEILSV